MTAQAEVAYRTNGRELATHPTGQQAFSRKKGDGGGRGRQQRDATLKPSG